MSYVDDPRVARALIVFGIANRCSRMSGLCLRRMWPRALMEFASWIPIDYSRCKR